MATGREHGDARSVHADGVVVPPGDAKCVVAATAEPAHSADSKRAIGTTRRLSRSMVGEDAGASTILPSRASLGSNVARRSGQPAERG
jgi:hypothetical protein